jgi:hypothetical protein
VARDGAALVERWNGAAWSVDPPPSNYALSWLSRVTCSSPAGCVAVGRNFDGEEYRSLVVRGSGASAAPWTSDPLPDARENDALSGVACRSASDCFAVGSAGAPNAHTLVEHWNGSKWSVVPSPNRRVADKPTDNGLSGVSCPSATSCFAVGISAGRTTLIERWNGTTWTIVPSPNPNPGRVNLLADVSCASAANCFAVGFTDNGSKLVALIERWNGTKWTRVVGPQRKPGGSSELEGVSCTSATACTAVGYDTGSNGWTRTLVLRWNGTKWTIVASATPNPNGLGAILSGVSCTSATSCTAVGATTQANSLTSFTTKSVIERWNGTKWTLVASPRPAYSSSYSLGGVRCPSSTRCVAVGQYSASGVRTLVERYG